MVHSNEKYVILNVEDDDVSCFLLNEMLAGKNFSIIHKQTGKEAIEVFKSDGCIDLVLMDIKLPDIDGFQLTRVIKALKPEVPVIAVTAFAFKKDREECLNAGCDDYLAKPVNSQLLIQMIQKYLDQNPESRSQNTE